jgi:hypothetical protein
VPLVTSSFTKARYRLPSVLEPSWYLIAEEDQMISPSTQRFMAERMGARIRSERVDHTPLVTNPRSVIEVFMEAVAPVEQRG